jgi:hypothetical protein
LWENPLAMSWTTDSRAFDDAGIFRYGLEMIEAANDDDQEEDYGPALAYPPLYVLRTATYCPECGQTQHVYALGCVAYRDAEDDGEPVDDFHFLSRVESVPPPLFALLKAKLPSFYPDHTEEGEKPYLMNHCPCGAKLDDDFVTGDVGAAFWPDTPDGFGDFRLLRLPVEEPLPIVSSFTIGGGEFLDFANSWSW